MLNQTQATYTRFEHNGKISYGIVEDGIIGELKGGLFDAHERTGKQFKLGEVKLLWPCEPQKILAVGLNYKSHLGTRTAPSNPEIFYKPVTCLQNPGDPIRIPAEAEDTHFEGELVIVIGKTVRNASREEAAAAVFGATCGNDVSDRNWQRGPNADRQWWRAKGCDTFGPLGPWIGTCLNYGDLALRTLVNGEVLQEQRTSDLLFDVPDTISFISRFVTLHPGDVIYTGTPGNTKKMKPGDVIEVELEGIGVLRNPVEAGS
jgi:2-keto-4-pentenoate hydratase/2-oxohepta-3-ene-1,7-dioic acid hydratase in catechol pathway